MKKPDENEELVHFPLRNDKETQDWLIRESKRNLTSINTEIRLKLRGLYEKSKL